MKPISGFEHYLINKNGDVYSTIAFNPKIGFYKRMLKLKPKLTKHGYFVVTLQNNKIKKQKFIHRLIAENFIENKDDKPMVNHVNGIKIDNRIENLEWVTASENTQHAYDTGLNQILRGEKSSQAKITKLIVKEIFHLKDKGFNQCKIANKFNLSQSHVSNILRKKYWSHV